jgi:excisionase family DNA binding protein
MPAKTKRRRRKPAPVAPQRTPEVLDVKMTAALLTVSQDLVYELFAKGELPGRKVGRKWITTKAAVLRWIENTSAEDALTRAIERGDKDAITEALNTGKVRVASKKL